MRMGRPSAGGRSGNAEPAPRRPRGAGGRDLTGPPWMNPG
jgi:hypothetical protein